MKNRIIKIKYAIVTAILSVLCIYSFAQTDAQISYFMTNELAFNPSFAGANKGFRASLLARQQWIGFDKAPATQTLQADYKSKIGGIGLYIMNDGLGYEWSTFVKAQYAYHISLAEHTRLSAGFGAGVYHRQLDASELKYQNPSMQDPIGLYSTQNAFTPSLDAGIHLSHKNLILGLSSTHVAYAVQGSDFFTMPRHFYGYIQYQHDISSKLSLVPTAYVKSGGYITQYEVNTNLYVDTKYWVGATYRYDESIVGMAGIILKETIRIGYAYDFSIGPVKPYSNGNHEIILSVRIPPDERDRNIYQSTRLFN